MLTRPSFSLRIILLLLVLIVPQAYSQNSRPGTLSGYVYNEYSGVPLENVRVVIPELQQETLTDEGGYYSLSGVEHGRYNVIFFYPGFVTKTLTGMMIIPGNESEVNCYLDTRDAYHDVSAMSAEESKWQQAKNKRRPSRPAPSSILGQVVAADNGEPVYLCKVYVPGQKTYALSKPGGRFWMEKLYPGSYTVIAEHPGFETSRISAVAVDADKETELTIRLRRKTPVGFFKGQVLDASTGQPVPEVYVELEEYHEACITDLNGYFYFNNIAFGEYGLVFRHPDFTYKRVENSRFDPAHDDIGGFLLEPRPTQFISNRNGRNSRTSVPITFRSGSKMPSLYVDHGEFTNEGRPPIPFVTSPPGDGNRSNGSGHRNRGQTNPDSQFSITGLVFDANFTDKVVRNCRVHLVGTKRTVATDHYGAFAMLVPEPGKYDLEFTCFGYYAEIVSVDFTNPDAFVRLEIFLKPVISQ